MENFLSCLSCQSLWWPIPFSSDSWICWFPIPFCTTAGGLIAASLSSDRERAGVRGPPAASHKSTSAVYQACVTLALCSVLLVLPVLAGGRESEKMAHQRPCALHFSVLLVCFLSECLVFLSANPCELHCRPVDGHFSEKMLDAVTDGTPCFEGRHSRDICINGMCKVLGMFACFFLFNLILWENA